MITFADSRERIPEPDRTQVQEVLRQAILVARPAREHWTVTTHELPTGGVRNYDFALGTEARAHSH